MVLFILVITLVFLLGACILREKGDISAPTVISVSVFLLVAIIALINIPNWKRDISLNTYLLIVISLLFQIFGDITVRLFWKRKVCTECNDTLNNEKIFNLKVLIYLIFSFAALLYSIKINGGILNSLGYSFQSSLFLYYLRHKETLGYVGEVSTLSVVIHYLVIGMSYALVTIYIEKNFDKSFVLKSKTRVLFFVSVIPVLGMEFLTAGRDGFIRYFSTVTLSMLCYIRRTHFTPQKIFRAGLKKITIVMMMTIVIFLVAGIYTGKTQENTIFDTISIYISSSIIAFDAKMSDNSSVFTEDGDKRSFYGVYKLIDKLNGDYTRKSRADEFVQISSDGKISNIYTSFYDYYSDFGVIGLCIIQFFLGMFLGFIFKKTYSNNYKLWILLYSFYGYMLIRQITEAYFLKMFFTVTHISLLISVMLGYFFFCSNKSMRFHMWRKGV